MCVFFLVFMRMLGQYHSAMKKSLPAAIAVFLALSVSGLVAQDALELDPGFAIRNVTASFVGTPSFDGLRGKNSRRRTNWMEVEANFSWSPSNPEDQKMPFLNDLEATFYVVLETRVDVEEQRVLLVGKTPMVHVGEGRDLNVAMYVSPRALEQFFRNRVPANAGPTVVSSVGMTLARGGKIVAMFPPANARDARFWENMPPGTIKPENVLLRKSQTPFAFSAWDYYEQEKPDAAR
jgi:hypothetical protein